MKRVGRAARLIGPATKNVGAGRLHLLRNAQGQLFLLDGARPRHNRQLLAADLHAADINDGVVFFKLSARQFPRCEDRDHILDPGNCSQRLVGQNAIIPDHSDDRSLLPLGQMRGQTELPHAIHHMLDHGFGGVRFQHDNHGGLFSLQGSWLRTDCSASMKRWFS